MDLLHEMLAATAAARPDAPAVTDRTATLTYGQLARAVEAAASGLMSLGVGRGDRVAVWLPKRNEKVVALYAAMRAGGVAVPVNVLLKPPQVAHILGDSGAKVLVTTAARLADLVRDVPEHLGSLAAVVTVDSPAIASPQHSVVLDWAQLLGAATAVPAKGHRQ